MNTFRGSSWRFLLTALLTLTISGCASYRDDERKPISLWPLQTSEQKQSINLFVNGKMWINEKEVPADKIQSGRLGPWRAGASKIFEESGLFSDVKLSSEDQSDLRADIEIEQKEEFSQVLAFITGFTFGLSSIVVPQKSSDTITITTTFKDRDGHVLASSKQSETVNTWTQLFFLFAMPFRDSPATTIIAAYDDLHRIGLAEVHQKHLLNPRKAASRDLSVAR